MNDMGLTDESLRNLSDLHVPLEATVGIILLNNDNLHNRIN